MAKATREAYGEILSQLVRENPKIVVLDADLSSSTHAADGGKVDPKRFFNMGIAEQNMIGTAAGLAVSGYIPFASTFAMFATGRCWEQIRNSVAYPQLPVKIIGSHAGISVGEDGVSHQIIEDIAIMRAIPGLNVYAPCDQYQTKAVIAKVAGDGKPCYVRLGRSKVDDVYKETDSIDVDRVDILRRGKDIAIFACGLTVQSSLAAAELLAKDGYDPTVVNVCAVAPLDKDGITEVLENHTTVFTVEEHYIKGGLGGAIAETAAETCPRVIHRLGMTGFGESGSWQQLLAKYELDGPGVYRQIKKYL